jgi:SAM-dependent methyltransferase
MVVEALNRNSVFTKNQNLFCQAGFQKKDFESSYIEIRKKEGRLFSNSEVKLLPEVPSSHPLCLEWKIRRQSTQRLITYLSKRSKCTILEIGCGNGWLSNQLAELPNTEVIGLDVNETELTQAASVFNHSQRLAFVLGDIFTIKLPMHFDYVIFASSLQYFADLDTLFSAVSNFLTQTGEIHILDTPFYDIEKLDQAKTRSSNYFSQHDSSMDAHYFHHATQHLKKYDHTLLYNPKSLIVRLKNKIIKDSPFPWIRIKPAKHGG